MTPMEFAEGIVRRIMAAQGVETVVLLLEIRNQEPVMLTAGDREDATSLLLAAAQKAKLNPDKLL